MRSEEIRQLESIHLVVGDFNEGLEGLLLGQSTRIEAVELKEYYPGGPTCPLVAIPVWMVGNDVEGIGGGFGEGGATQVVRVLRLIDRRFQKVLVEHSVMAAVALYGLVVKSIDLITCKESWFLLPPHS